MPATARETPSVAVRVALPGGLWPGGRSHGETEPLREVAMRAVGVEDEVFLLDLADELPSVRATALLARCLVDGDRLAPALAAGDREALLLHLRRLTIGEAMDGLLRCPAESCGEPMEIKLGVSDLLVAPYGEVRNSYDLSVDVEGSRYDICFRLPTAGDLDGTAALARSDPRQAAGEILRRCVIRATSNGIAIEAQALPAAAAAAVSGAMAERDPQAELELEMRCPACGTPFSALFDTTAFFLRELEERAARLLGEVHTLALYYHWSEAEILRLPPRRRAQYLALVSGAQTAAGAR